jgi:hypothetical protein
MKKNTRKQVVTEMVHTQVEARQKQLQLRPCMKHPKLRCQRSLGTPSNVMTPPTRSKMQEQEEDTPIRTASTENAEEKRITEEGTYLEKLAPPPLLPRHLRHCFVRRLNPRAHH